MEKKLFFLLMAMSSLAFADNCDFLIAQFNQKPVSIISPEPTASNSEAAIATRQQAMALFADGAKQCENGQQTEGAEKIQQAINLLQNQ